MGTMTIAGVRPAGELADVFVLYDDGTASHMQVIEGQEPQLARPGRFVTAEQYEARLQELHDQNAAYVAELEAADEARHRADFEALVGLGVPEDSARRMAGYGELRRAGR
ncbi:hypothetical protein ACPCSG_27035 [Streptomyces cellulosae]